MKEKTYVEGFHDKDEVVKMTYLPLGDTDIRVSKFSLGGSPFGGLYESLEEGDAVAMVREALRAGINYIDTAPFYGQGRSEAFIGKALKDIPRKAYYVATKVGRYDWNPETMFDFSAQKTRASFEKSLNLLGLDYVDIIQVHDLEYAKDLDQVLNETLPTLQELVDEGKARYIGITGYPLYKLKEVIEKSKVKISTVLSYSRFSLIDNELLKYLPFLKERGIGVVNAGVLALGLLTETGPQSWHPATEEIKDVCKKAAKFCQENGVDIAKLAIKYCMNEDTTILIGVGTMENLKKNLRIFTEPQDKTEMQFTNELRNRFFLKLSHKNWEGKELDYDNLKQLNNK